MIEVAIVAIVIIVFYACVRALFGADDGDDE
jgi:hypothetical protein